MRRGERCNNNQICSVVCWQPTASLLSLPLSLSWRNDNNHHQPVLHLLGYLISCLREQDWPGMTAKYFLIYKRFSVRCSHRDGVLRLHHRLREPDLTYRVLHQDHLRPRLLRGGRVQPDQGHLPTHQDSGLLPAGAGPLLPLNIPGLERSGGRL